MRRLVAAALERQASGAEYPFVVCVADRVVGSTRYLEVDEANRTAEVGWTWYSSEVWATHVNPAAKLLLLQHAFEDWAAIRIQFKLDSRNERSEAAVRKLGAVYEGCLRSHRVRPDGTIRDSLVFSIISSEWPKVRAGLEDRLR
jgi:RimJ/RimL family protein N-acetyltransferase